MGYCYEHGTNRLVCDGCGLAGGVRKRRCPYGWCPPPALCKSCYAKHGGLRGVHGDQCRAGAAEYDAKQAARQARIDAGDTPVNAAWGSWHATVPQGKVGLYFDDGVYRLADKADYVNGGDTWLSEIATQPWPGHPGATTKEVTF